MRIFYIFLFFSSLVYSQDNSPELKIDLISVSDSISGIRKFTVSYNIRNKIDKDVSFINCAFPLNTVYPNVKDLQVYAAILENEKPVHQNILQSNIRFIQFKSNFENAVSEAERKAIAEEYSKTFVKDSTARKAQRERMLKINDFDYVKSSIITLKPNEIRNFTESYYWNKTRYYKQEDLEYYIDENTSYFLELSIKLHKDEFKYFFSEIEFKKIKENPNFIEGIIRSNQVELNFKD